jgi:hypothetical protein
LKGLVNRDSSFKEVGLRRGGNGIEGY